MSSLSSTSTRDEIHAAYLDNASYEEDASVAKAKAFITACRFLLSPRITPQASTGPGNGGQVEFNLEIIRGEMQAAQQWLCSNDTTNYDSFGGVKYADFSGFRGESNG
jgi:hypothetical protein